MATFRLQLASVTSDLVFFFLSEPLATHHFSWCLISDVQVLKRGHTTTLTSVKEPVNKLCSTLSGMSFLGVFSFSSYEALINRTLQASEMEPLTNSAAITRWGSPGITRGII